MSLEREFQAHLIRKFNKEFPNCEILKNDANYKPGFPDILILNNEHWAVLECKRERRSLHRPNQEYYINKLGKMGYANFIFPENEEEVLRELQYALGPCGPTRLPKW